MRFPAAAWLLIVAWFAASCSDSNPQPDADTDADGDSEAGEDSDVGGDPDVDGDLDADGDFDGSEQQDADVHEDANPNAPVVWVAASLDRVAQDEAPGSTLQAAIHAGRGEVQSFQIAVRPPASGSGLTGVSVTAPDLVGTEASIPRSNITLYREHYVLVDVRSIARGEENDPLLEGWYPDPLVPFVHPDTGEDLSGTYDAVPFDVASGRNELVWVDVSVPRDTPPGQYSGVFQVVSAEGTSQVPLDLTVWKFTLPLAPSQESSFIVRRSRSTDNDIELLKHRIMPSEPASRDDEPELMGHGLAAVRLGYYVERTLEPCELTGDSTVPAVADIQALVDTHADGLHLYAWAFDEISPCVSEFASVVRAWAGALHEAGVDQLITTPPDPLLYDDGSGTGRSAVDIWVVLPSQYDSHTSEVAFVLEKGDRVWSYNALAQDGYSPKWLIDYPLVDERIHAGFLNAVSGMTGLLYWSVDYWVRDCWVDTDISGVFAAGNYPGEGVLVYDGEPVGLPGRIVPSMRLKALRDGMQDYDYVALLRDAGLGTEALAVASTVAPDWTLWTRSTAEIEAARLELGQMLDAATP